MRTREFFNLNFKYKKKEFLVNSIITINNEELVATTITNLYEFTEDKMVSRMDDHELNEIALKGIQVRYKEIYKDGSIMFPPIMEIH